MTVNYRCEYFGIFWWLGEKIKVKRVDFLFYSIVHRRQMPNVDINIRLQLKCYDGQNHYPHHHAILRS